MAHWHHPVHRFKTSWHTGIILFIVSTRYTVTDPCTHLDELLVVDLAVSVYVCLADHLIHLLVCELLTQVGHHVPQLQKVGTSPYAAAAAAAAEKLQRFGQYRVRGAEAYRA
jgi:hypothetical protein